MTNFGSIAGNTSPVDNRNTSLHEKSFREGVSALSGKPSLLPNILPSRKSLADRNRMFCVCHNDEDIALWVDVKKKKFVVTSPDFAPDIYGVILASLSLSLSLSLSPVSYTHLTLTTRRTV